MNDLERSLCEQVRADHDYVVALRRWFHRHPELALEEVETQARIEQELDALGLAHRRVAGTGVYAEIEGTKPAGGTTRTLALRADIDALPVTEASGVPYASLYPGRMHACGHDAHNAALIGAARVLCANRDKFAGKVLLTWQPGEEIGYGARVILDTGCIDRADRSFGLHLASELPVGTVAAMAGPNNASVDWFRIRVHGQSAHVAAPELGVDAAYIAAQILVSAQALITRRTNPLESVILGIGKVTAGTAYNIVAQEAELEGTIRTLTPELRCVTKERLETLACTTAALFGGTAEVAWRDNTSPLINDAAAAAEAQRLARSLFGAEHVITQRRPSLSGDDFAEYILRVPGVYVYVGSGNPNDPNTQVPHHSERFAIDEDCLTAAVALHVCYAVEYLNGLL